MAMTGKPGTRWCANDSNLNHWWQVDLGDVYNLGGDEVLWEKGAVYGYVVAVSTNNTTWTTVLDKSGNTSSAQDQSGRFYRQRAICAHHGDRAACGRLGQFL
jgi:hypothetical protein